MDESKQPKTVRTVADALREMPVGLPAGVATPQQQPKPNDNPSVWDMVISDMKDRDDFGRAKYGAPVQAFNGRDSLVDAYQEALDLAVYLRQAIEERKADARRKAGG